MLHGFLYPDYWSEDYLDGEVADYAFGATTMEVLFRAYNAYHGDKFEVGIKNATGYGYKAYGGSVWQDVASFSPTNGVGALLGEPNNIFKTPNVTKDWDSVWIASPGCGGYDEMCDLSEFGSAPDGGVSRYTYFVRPMVQLKK